MGPQENLAELVVKDKDQLAEMLDQGNGVRHVAATNMNDRSSRSHSCFIIKIEQKTKQRIGDIEKETALHAKVNLVSLPMVNNAPCRSNMRACCS